MTRESQRRLVASGSVLAVLCALALLGTFGLRRSRSADAVDTTGETVLPRVRTGTELVAVYITSSRCPASRDTALTHSLRAIRRELGRRAMAEGKRLVWMGVALDKTPEEGIDFLREYGPFDEILAGGSWLNLGSLEFLIRGDAGELTTPQLVLVERDIVAGQTTLSVSPDRLVMRRVGASRINAFASDVDSLWDYRP